LGEVAAAQHRVKPAWGCGGGDRKHLLLLNGTRRGFDKVKLVAGELDQPSLDEGLQGRRDRSSKGYHF